MQNAFKGHVGIIHSLSFSPNGRHLVSTSDDNTVRIWRVRDGAANYLTEANPVLLDTPHYRSALFSPDGRHVAASHRDGMVRLWCVRTRQLVRRVNAYTNWVDDIAFMPDGKGLVSRGRDRTSNYWDISSFTNGLREANDLDEYNSGTKEQTHHDRGPFRMPKNVRWFYSFSICYFVAKRFPSFPTTGWRCLHRGHAGWQMGRIGYGVKYLYLGQSQYGDTMHP